MISIYLIIAIVCAVLLIVTVALGGVVSDVDIGGGDLDIGGPDVGVDYGDFVGPGVSPLSLPIVLAFGTTFGGVGALFEQMGFDPFLIPIISVFLSILTAGGMYLFIVWLFVKTQATSVVDLSSLVGKEGTVSVAIEPGKQGQIVVVTVERGRTLVPAVSDVAIPTDAVVEVQAVVGNGVRVTKK